MKQERTSEGKYKNRGWFKRFIIKVFWLAFLALVLWSGYKVYKETQPDNGAPVVQVQEDDGLTEAQRAKLAKQAELAKKETVLMNKKEALEKRYELESTKLELDLQDIRKEKTNFQ